MTHKEMTAHIRNRLKASGIKAKCSLYEACGVKYVRVSVPTSENVWTAEETKQIRHIADCNKLTGARKSPINMAEGLMANTKYGSFHFEYWGA